MNDDKQHENRPCWFVGSSVTRETGKVDETDRFVEAGIWETNHPTDRVQNKVNSIKVGDRIAIKSSFRQRNGLPFENTSKDVSVMRIKATGTVTENPHNGQTLKVDWERVSPSRDWYFYTKRSTVWEVSSGDWKSDELIDFTFGGAKQDYGKFMDAYQGETNGNGDVGDDFLWIPFYESIADGLLQYREDRPALVKGLREIKKRVSTFIRMIDRFEGDREGRLQDIDPFTVMASFNRQTTNDNRHQVAIELARFLGIGMSETEIKERLTEPGEGGVPVSDNRTSWFFAFSEKRQPDDIDALWELFNEALRFADSGDENNVSFSEAYDNAISRRQVKWKLTMGLYWIRPRAFPTLDAYSRKYIKNALHMGIGRNAPNKCCSADDYLTIREQLKAKFQDDDSPFHSFPELSRAAWWYEPPEEITPAPGIDGLDDEEKREPKEITPYSIGDIINDGCFIEEARLHDILARLEEKKNLILQGPPGTGKTWLAKRLAYALIRAKKRENVRPVQFHPNQSYEDFVRGYRPSQDARLELVDGAFLKAAASARENPDDTFVVVIEEINRGNPAQIFGEMLTLLEADKRTPEEALKLSYGDERFHIPPNLYVVGTMNIADRSLALVDLALRRRFAFVDLKPEFEDAWIDWVEEKNGVSRDFLRDVQVRMKELNAKISDDPSLGPQFQIGHSYFISPDGQRIEDPRKWFRQVVETDIVPQLKEYWFDAAQKAEEAKDELLKGF